jgi:hypothetical protein
VKDLCEIDLDMYDESLRAFVTRPPRTPGRPACFVTDWVYETHVEMLRLGQVYHLWSCEHREGYTAYQLTMQPPNGSKRPFIKPSGWSHFTSMEGVAWRTGLKYEGGLLRAPLRNELL